MVKKKRDIVDPYNEPLNEIYKIIEEKNKIKYFEGIILLSASIEDMLRLAMFWKYMKSPDIWKLSNSKTDELMNYIGRLSFHNEIKTVYLQKIVDENTYIELETYRKMRNKFIHGLLSRKPSIKEEEAILKLGRK